MSEYDEVLREVYGTADEVVREVYTRRRRAKRAKPTPGVDPVRPLVLEFSSVPYRVTSDARIRCDCGVYVYSESRYGRPPVLPATCWRCGKDLP